MTDREIRSVTLEAQRSHSFQCLMDQEIKGTAVNYYRLRAGQELCLPICEDFIRILIVCKGCAELSLRGNPVRAYEKYVYVASPMKPVGIMPISDAEVLEICRFLSRTEVSQTHSDEKGLPYALAYEDAPTYTEDCKSAKTVSRMLIPARVIPRFAMGSVETRGDDLIKPHRHPMLEQFFFGLDDNDCCVLIDGAVFPFSKNMLLHIPLGSNHGVQSSGSQVVHYLWMDFLLNDEGLKYMDDAHSMCRADSK